MITSICLDAQDTNDDGEVNVADPLYSLAYIFTEGLAPPVPFPGCGSDPTADALGVWELPSLSLGSRFHIRRVQQVRRLLNRNY